MRCVLIILLAGLVPSPLAGQNTDDPPRGLSRRLSIVLELGSSLGGPGAGLAEQMRQAGFDDTSPGGCFFFCAEPTAHPKQDRPAGSVGFSARYAISPRLAVGAGYSNSSLGGARGYRADPEGPGLISGDRVNSHWDATMRWAAVFWKPQPALRIGGGPGWYRLENLSEDLEVSRLGLMGEVGLELPPDRRFFLNLTVRGHLVPAKDVVHGSRTAPITLRPNWTHAALLAGLGIHL